MRKGFKILFKILGGTILLLVLLAILVPVIFKEEITESVRRNIDNRIEGDFLFKEAHVGILKTFPNLCLTLDDPALTGTGHPNGDSLLTARTIDIVVDIMSVLRSSEPIKVVGLSLAKPRVSIYMDTLGNPNFKMLSADTSITNDQGSPVIVEIDDYQISSGRLQYSDALSSLSISLEELDHQGSLVYNDNLITLRSDTKQANVSIRYDGMYYLEKVKYQGRNDIDIDLNHGLYSLVNNIFSLNALQLNLTGEVTQSEALTKMDLKFESESGDFKNFVSLLPNMYTREFDRVSASGSMAFSGKIRGELSDKTVPTYDVSLDIQQGTFQYPGKPLGFTGINLQGNLKNRSSAWEPYEVDIASLKFLLNNQPFSVQAYLLNPAGQATLRGHMDGRIDLTDLYKAYPLQEVSDLKGLLNADVKFDVASGKPATQQQLTGTLSIRDLLAVTGENRLSIPSGNIVFDPKNITVLTESASLNGSALQVNASVSNVVNWLTADETMFVTGSFSAGKLDLTEPAADESDAALPPASKRATTDISKVHMDAKVSVDTLLYDEYVITQGSAAVTGNLQNLTLNNLICTVNGSSLLATGTLSNIDNYLSGSGPLKGKLNCTADQVVVDNWIEESSDETTSNAETATAYTAIPGDLDLEIDFTANQLFYDDINIKDPRGHFVLRNQTLEVNDFSGKAMGGTMTVSGLYNTENIAHPAFNLKYNISQWQFDETFREIETFRTLAPIARYLQGIFNSTLVMEGRLGEEYMPELNTLNATGFLETLNGKLEKADIFDKLSQFLNLKEPLKIDLGKTRNWFEVEKGFVILKEATQKIDDYEIAYGGRHKIDGEMDYLVKLNIPADRVTANPVGTLAKSGYEQLQNQAAKYGVQLKTIDRFIVHVGVSGRLAEPRFAVKLFDASGKTLKDAAASQLTEVQNQVRDTLTQVANKALQEAKDSAETLLNAAIDSAQIKAQEKLKELGQDVISQTTGKLDSTMQDSISNKVLDQAGDKAKDVLGQSAENEIDKIKDALDSWDPFKKKKKNED